MDNRVLADKYLGCILGAAAGDAMGAPTETKSTRQIAAMWGGRVCDFQTPPADVPSRGRAKGQVTDAFSIPYVLTKHLLAAEGRVSRSLATAALKEWGQSEWFEPFAGMTTRKVINRLNEDDNISVWAYAGHLGNKLFKGHYYALSSNGAAVKAYPAALLHPGDFAATVNDTVELTLASHDDPISISGACAVAAAISVACKEQAKLYDMIVAALNGAREGDRLAREQKDIWIYPGPTVIDRLPMAIEIAVTKGSAAITKIRDLIGSGPAIAETVPAAFGLLIAHDGQVLPALYDAVNIGDETAAIASLVGALGGTLQGAQAFPDYYLPLLDAANGFDLKLQAELLLSLISSK